MQLLPPTAVLSPFHWDQGQTYFRFNYAGRSEHHLERGKGVHVLSHVVPCMAFTFENIKSIFVTTRLRNVLDVQQGIRLATWVDWLAVWLSFLVWR